MLEGTEFGRKIHELLGRLNPELRQQVLSSAISAEEMPPELLQDLTNSVGYDHLVDALQRLNATGSAFRRAPSAPCRCSRVGGRPGTTAAAASPAPRRCATRGSCRQLLDGLLAEDEAQRYMSADYEKAIASLQGAAQALAQRPKNAGWTAVPISRREGELHFLGVCGELFEATPEDAGLCAVLAREDQPLLRHASRGRAPARLPASDGARHAAARSAPATPG